MTGPHSPAAERTPRRLRVPFLRRLRLAAAALRPLPPRGLGTADATDVFCPRLDQPPVLLETADLYVIPDRYPVTAGHLLVVSAPHRPCWAAADPAVLRRLDTVAALLRRFLQDEYGMPALLWENGVSGQSVHHAHLHVIPLRLDGGLPPLTVHDRAIPVPGWRWVRRQYERAGAYHYIEYGGRRRLLPAGTDDVYRANLLIGTVLGLQATPDGRQWVRTTGQADRDEVARRWARWAVAHRRELEAALPGVRVMPDTARPRVEVAAPRVRPPGTALTL